MGTKLSGVFSLSLQSLKLQVDTLLECAGGADATALLDVLSGLPAQKQKSAIQTFMKVLNDYPSMDDAEAEIDNQELQAFEEDLYRDLVDSMSIAVNCSEPVKRFEVLSGGKDKKPAVVANSQLIDFCAAKRNRSQRA